MSSKVTKVKSTKQNTEINKLSNEPKFQWAIW